MYIGKKTKELLTPPPEDWEVAGRKTIAEKPSFLEMGGEPNKQGKQENREKGISD